MKYENFESAVSLERFARYLAWSAGDRTQAIALYSLNTRLSECLYTPLQMLEVVLRNRIHMVLEDWKGEGWFQAEAGVVTGTHQGDQILKAIGELAKDGKPASACGVVAGLTFSFWTAMFGSNYEVMWQQALHRIADTSAPRGLRRKSFSGPLTRMRMLRNRIAHHEPILAWNLPKHHAQMLEIIGWLSPPAAEWCRENDRFPEAYPETGYFLAQP